jgi:hypothetical protein
MGVIMKIFGAKASIHLRYEGDLASLAAKLSAAMIMPAFQVGHRESPPHDLMASSEALGWELWLEQTSAVQSFHYLLRMQTEHSVEESFNDQMHDLSPWLARYVSSICNVEVLVTGARVVFSRGTAKHLESP